MSRQMPVGLLPLFKKRETNIETHSTLQLAIFNELSPTLSYFLATAKLVITGVTFKADLRQSGAVRTSLTRAVDQVQVELQNVDTILGIDLIKAQESLAGAEAKFGRYWRDLDNDAEYHKGLLSAVVAGVDINENVVRLSLISDPYAAVSVGASRRVARLCQWRFRDPNTCGYSGAELECNFLINDTGGCQGRHGDPLKRAKHGGFVYIESKTSISGAASLPNPAANQLIKNDSSTFLQQPAVKFSAASITNDAGNKQTVVAYPFDGVTRTNSNFNKSDTTLANITGLSFNVEAGKSYRFRFHCNTSLALSGGEQFAIAGTCTATNINYSILSITTGAAIPIASQLNALGGSAGNGGYTNSIVVIEGGILVNAAGTLTVQFAQSAASGTSTVLPNATFEVQESA